MAARRLLAFRTSPFFLAPFAISAILPQAIVVLAMIRYPAIFVVCLGKRMVKGSDQFRKNRWTLAISFRFIFV
jgi:hypothetical protein